MIKIILNALKTSYIPRIQSTNEKKYYQVHTLERNSQYKPAKQNLQLKIPPTCYSSDTSLLRRSTEYVHRNLMKMTYDYLINKDENNKRKNDNLRIKASNELVESMIKAKESMISCVQEDIKELNKSNQRVLELYRNVLKKQTSQVLSKDLLDPSFQTTRFVDDIPINDKHHELQKQE